MQINPNIKRCRIDVGLSATAPYSAYWLSKYNDIVVLAFEPNPYNMKRIWDGEAWVKDSPYPVQKDTLVKYNGETICNWEDRGNQFIPYEFAVGNVDGVQSAKFYCTSTLNTGCSSLLKPVEARLNGVVTEKEIQVGLISLGDILKDFPYHQIPIIDYLKTDTQGYDLEVLKGCREHLHKICFVQCEWTTNGAYEDEPHPHQSWKALLEYMAEMGFRPYYQSTTDAAFVNESLIPQIIEGGILNDGYENQKGTNYII